MTSIQLARGGQDIAFAERLRVDLALRGSSVQVTAFTLAGGRVVSDSTILAIVPDRRAADYDASLRWVHDTLAQGLAPVLIVPEQDGLDPRVHSQAAAVVYSGSLSYDEVFEELSRALHGSLPPWLDVRVRPSLIQSPTGVAWWSDDLVVADHRFEHVVRLSPNDSTVMVPGLQHPHHLSLNGSHLAIANTSADEVLECEIVDNMATEVETIRSVDGLDLRQPRDVSFSAALSVIVDTGNDRVLFRSGEHRWKAVELEEPVRSPSAVCVDEAGFWIADSGRHRIVRCDFSGRQLLAFGERGTEPGRFGRPVGVARWRNLLFVTEEENARVQVLEVRDREASGQTELVPRLARLAAEFIGQPVGVSVSSTHRLAVTDRVHKCIWLIDLVQLAASLTR